jgi:hypothetical protein
VISCDPATIVDFIPLRKSLAVPAGAEVVHRLKLKQGIRVQAVDPSGL